MLNPCNFKLQAYTFMASFVLQYEYIDSVHYAGA